MAVPDTSAIPAGAPASEAGARSGASRPGGIALAAAIVLVAASMRLPVTVLGPVLEEIRTDLGIGPAMAGLLTALPVLTFGLAGTLVPRLRQRVPTGAAVSIGLVVVIGATVARPLGGAAVLAVGTAVLMAGITILNVLLPVVVRSAFPGREGWITGGYVASLQLGAAASAGLTVPLAAALGGWPRALAGWAVIPVMGLLAWLVVAGRVSADGRRDAGTSALTPRRLARDRVAVALVVFFAIQAVVAYVTMGWLPTLLRDAGMAAASAGAMVGVVTLVSIPVSLVVPGWLASRPHQRHGAWLVALPWVVAYVGLLVAPVPLAWLWATLLGVGFAGFPLSLALFGLRSATSADTLQVSTVAQSVGYLAALPGPLLVGVLAEATGGWDVPLLVLLALMVPLVASGWIAGANAHIGGD